MEGLDAVEGKGSLGRVGKVVGEGDQGPVRLALCRRLLELLSGLAAEALDVRVVLEQVGPAGQRPDARDWADDLRLEIVN